MIDAGRLRSLDALFLLALALTSNAPVAHAHTLGVDPLRLTERGEGRYELVSTVPQTIAHLIVAPKLPERCALKGSPRGERGRGEVRFNFTCDTPLTARDELALPWRREGVMLTERQPVSSPVKAVRSRLTLACFKRAPALGSTQPGATQCSVSSISWRASIICCLSLACF